MNKRFFAIDAVRGWVMILMALDHAMAFCYAHVLAEGFQGTRPESMPDVAHYLTRFITLYCAPAFLFLAGLSVGLYTLSRRRQGLSEGQITRKLLTRGLLLMALQMTMVNWSWGFGLPPYASQIYFGVLTCIGSGLIVLAFARRLPVPVLASGSAFLVLLIPFLLSTFPLLPGTDQPLLELGLHPNAEGWLGVRYPILPWLGVMGFGCACGFWLGAKPERITKWFLPLGAILLIGWLALRLAGGYGNLTPYLGGEWQDFMLMSKYPPSPVFLMWTLGGVVIAIAAHDYIGSRSRFRKFWGTIVLFGQTALFFYVVHLLLYRLLPAVPLLRGNLASAYLAWLLGLAAMVPLCAAYWSLKRRYPRSVLQYV